MACECAVGLCTHRSDCRGLQVTASVKRTDKLDEDKVDLTFLFEYFPDALEAVAWQCEYGSRKYARGGWKKMTDIVGRVTKALLRHFKAVAKGELYDEGDSGLPHDAAIAWNALVRLQRRIDLGEIVVRRGNDLDANNKPILGTARPV